MKRLLTAAAMLTVAFTPSIYAQQDLLRIDPGIMNRNTVISAANRLNIADLLRRDIARNFGFHDGTACATPPTVSTADIDRHRSLFVHDSATLTGADFSLRRTLQQISDQVSGSAPGTTPESIFRQFWDTQNDSTVPGEFADASNINCNENDGKINGFPLNNCPRPEGIEALGSDTEIASRIDSEYRPISLVNRLDLAHAGWRNCGEHRIIYGKQDGFAKNLIIFEAVLPNPKPGCRSACRDVIEFWMDLSDDMDVTSRATKLAQFFYDGLPGFQPVVHVNHYSASGATSSYGGSGSGQIRTNQFLTRAGMGTGPWTLKEFKTLLSCTNGSCDFDFVPISVKSNPYGILWNRDIATGAASPPSPITDLTTLATEFQNSVVAQVTVDKLANPDINAFSYAVDLNKNAGESQEHNTNIDHYPNQFDAAADATFRNSLQAVASGFGLTGEQIVNRATALSCAGCHQPGTFGLTGSNAIGPGQNWPNSLSFVHAQTSENPILFSTTQATVFGGNQSGFQLSPALNDVFLPARENHLADIANQDVCDCVPNLRVLKVPPVLERRFPDFILQSQEKLRSVLGEKEKQFRMRSRITEKDVKEHFEGKRKLIRSMEKEREAMLVRGGAKLREISDAPVKIQLQVDTQRMTPTQLNQVKIEAVKKISDSEPPRKTITGSFRVH